MDLYPGGDCDKEGMLQRKNDLDEGGRKVCVMICIALMLCL